MTDKELRKLKREELLEILYYLQKEAETLRHENQELKEQIKRIAEREVAPALPEDFYEQMDRVVQKALNDYLKSRADVVKTAWKDLPDKFRKKVMPQQNRESVTDIGSEYADNTE